MAPNLDELLRAFREGRGDEVWSAFLDEHSGLLLQVARSVTRDEDAAADAFVFCCERLAANGFARLRQFDPSGPATSATWLRAVARNLCLDQQRRARGRFRVFESIARLPVLEQLVFRRRHRDRLTLAETLAILQAELPNLTLDAVAAADRRVNLALTPRQVWSVTASRPTLESLSAIDDQDSPLAPQPVAPEPSPEELFRRSESGTRVRKAVAALPARDRLLLRLRIEQELTLSEIARIAGLANAQQADRRLRGLYDRLRACLE